MLPQAIKTYLQSNRQRHLASLCDFLRIASIANVQDQPDSCQQAAHWLADYLRRLGMDVKIMPCKGGPHDRPNLLANLVVDPALPTVLFYGHYDVQPPDPLGPWQSPPFDPQVRDGKLFARGSSDDKGQLFAHLMAIEAWQKAGGGLPVNVKFFAEGEEEIGSPNLASFLKNNAALLAADAAIVSDSQFHAPGLPSITYSLRGVAYFDLLFKGPATDLHSGLHGGAVTNPVNAIGRLVAAMHDDSGRVLIPGFYDDVMELTAQERAEWAQLPSDEAAYAASLGVKHLAGGENGYSELERRWGRPTLDCNGIYGGYSGPGSKTIIPAQAGVKFSIRLVPNQTPDKIVQAVKAFVAAHTPRGIEAQLSVHTANAPVMLSTSGPAVEAVKAGLVEGFGCKVWMIRCGASVPITGMLQQLGLDVVVMGLGLPDDNLHGPNENFVLDQLWNGSVASAAFMQNMKKAR